LAKRRETKQGRKNGLSHAFCGFIHKNQMITRYELKKSSLVLVLVFVLALCAVPLLAFIQTKEPLWSYNAGGAVWSVAISSDGNYIAAGSEDNKVYLFSRASGTMLWSYKTGNWVHLVAISSDGNYIVTGSWDDEVYLFSRADNTPIWGYNTGDVVRSVAISSDGNYIVAGDLDNKVYLFSKNDNTPLWSYETGNGVSSVAISSDGSYIVAGSRDDKVYLFSRSSGTPLWDYTTDSYVLSVAISSDGSYITAGGEDKNVYLFSRTDNVPLWNYTTDSYVNYVAISSDGSYIAAGIGAAEIGHPYKVYLFSSASDTPLRSYTVGGGVCSLAISPDGNYIVTGIYYYGDIYLFSRASDTPLWSYKTSGSYPLVAISSDNNYIAVGSGDRNVYLFSQSPPSGPNLTLVAIGAVVVIAVAATAAVINFKMRAIKRHLLKKSSLKLGNLGSLGFLGYTIMLLFSIASNFVATGSPLFIVPSFFVLFLIALTWYDIGVKLKDEYMKLLGVLFMVAYILPLIIIVSMQAALNIENMNFEAAAVKASVTYGAFAVFSCYLIYRLVKNDLMRIVTSFFLIIPIFGLATTFEFGGYIVFASVIALILLTMVLEFRNLLKLGKKANNRLFTLAGWFKLGYLLSLIVLMVFWTQSLMYLIGLGASASTAIYSVGLTYGATIASMILGIGGTIFAALAFYIAR
jgi:WD40 repeat protein